MCEALLTLNTVTEVEPKVRPRPRRSTAGGQAASPRGGEAIGLGALENGIGQGEKVGGPLEQFVADRGPATVCHTDARVGPSSTVEIWSGLLHPGGSHAPAATWSRPAARAGPGRAGLGV